ncbi:endo-1,4-beta-xylanase [Nesterenkonia sp. Act20]|uniref:endo-1,4-beta-xylanase n=1 Tax=Nesterenkonia sp. Act20 TaxID=1483432 RepID=UPI001C445907|nr:endo-1,4-beta-xylanase [Nesterenkonia sp. Act20]
MFNRSNRGALAAAVVCVGALTFGTPAAAGAATTSVPSAQNAALTVEAGAGAKGADKPEHKSKGRPDHAGQSGRPDHAGKPGPPDHAKGKDKGKGNGKGPGNGGGGGDAAQCQFTPEGGAAEGAWDRDSLAGVAPDDLRIGNIAAGGGHHSDAEYPDPFPSDPEYREHLASEYSSVTHENFLKWEFVHPEPGVYDFEQADAVVAYAEENGMDIRGHALFWHSQNPDWLEDGDYSQDELREILEEHVRTVVSRYAGCIDQWDVANEIFQDDAEASIRDSDNIWIRELGPGILDDVFTWAHEEDPEALLFYNDYNVDGLNAKADAYYSLITDQLERGIPVHGFGSQTHLSMQYGFDNSYQENLQRFDDLGLYTAVTEIDVRGEVDENDQMSAEDRAGAAERYETVLEACLAVSGCNSFTIWGTLDAQSWVPNTFPGEGDATLHEGDYERKPAYCILQRTLVEHEEGDAAWDADPAFEECRSILQEAGL